MWETLLGITLFGSFVWMAIVTGVFIIICFLSDVYENGFWAFFSLIGFCALFFLYGSHAYDVVLGHITWTMVTLYFGLGLIHSFVRTFFYGRRIGKAYYKALAIYETKKAEKPDSYASKPEPMERNLKGHVFRWWFMWPISLLTWIFTDIVKDIWDFIYKLMNRLFILILNFGASTAK